MEPLNITCPVAVGAIIDLFASQGEVAYPVGGCVRDTLMGREPHDWDVAVTTVPQRTKEICEGAGYRVIPTGMAHGTVTVLVPDPERGGRMAVECTTCRTEGGYSDGRHPDSVAFTGLIEDDLSRRDFTVNALAITAVEGGFALIDLFGGREDLGKGIIRCVGDPHTRLTEDALRILRAVRFAVKLGFEIDPATRQALMDCAHGLSRISRERIRDEFEKTLCSPDPVRGVCLLEELGLMPYVLPYGISLNGTGDLTVLPSRLPLRLACLMWGMDTADVRENLAGLRLPNETVAEVLCLLETPVPTEVTAPAARRLRRACGDAATSLLTVAAARGIDTARMAELVKASEVAEDCVRTADLAVSGKDLMALGVPRGPKVGEILHDLLEMVLEDPEKNTRECLINEVKKGQ